MKSELTGRPRSQDIDRAIIVAALDEVAEVGYVAASMTGIARRASVPRATVYRRWRSKEELVVDAMTNLSPKAPSALTGNARVDLAHQMSVLINQWPDKRSAAVTLSLITEVARNPRLYEVWEDRILVPLRERISAVLVRGIESGQIREDADVEVIIELIFALPLHITMRRRPQDVCDLADRFMVTVFDGICERDLDAESLKPPTQRLVPKL